jgi:hypothetical protein
VVQLVCHFVDYAWNLLVKCNGSAVTGDIYFAFMLLWEPEM